jgi:hypothetical protein
MSHGLSATVVIVPGLRDHVPDHWQTRLADELPDAITVPRMQEGKLSCAAWVAALDRTLDAVAGPVVLVAHSAGAMIVVHWAQSHRRAILGALLAAPPDFETPLPAGYPTPDVLQANGWLPTPRAPLPFPSIVAAGADDPLGRIERIEALARDWGSRFVDLGNVGHLNPASGYGPWPDAHRFIRTLAT